MGLIEDLNDLKEWSLENLIELYVAQTKQQGSKEYILGIGRMIKERYLKGDFKTIRIDGFLSEARGDKAQKKHFIKEVIEATDKNELMSFIRPLSVPYSFDRGVHKK